MPHNPLPPELTPPPKRSLVTPSFIGALIAILTPGAYLLGLSFYDGYMRAFGVESDGFPISTPNVYVFSYHTIGYFLLSLGETAGKALNHLVEPPTVYWMGSIIFICITLIYWLLKVVKVGLHPKAKNILDRIKQVTAWLHWKNNDFTKSVGIVGVASYGVIVIAGSAMSIALFWWLLPMSAYSKGNELALNRIKQFREKGCQADPKSQWDTCFFVLDGKGQLIHEGLLIAVNEKEIAIFKKDGSYVFARQDDFVLRRKLH